MDNRKIDRLIAEKIMGFEVRNGQRVEDGKRFGIPSYSQKIECAWQVVEKLKVKGYWLYGLGFVSDEDYSCSFYQGSGQMITEYDKSAPLAICKAALKTVGVEV
ncbi:hypothetical protein [Virgibacillus sp. Bac332]|uniref:BC1872 family protein n=1 Tax=Virgibacillus sp. Bac332 TaxID=2419842 RepID=UPI000EF4E2C5|nr:hypothetical protein [Virgibacillus sp. Bac332]